MKPLVGAFAPLRTLRQLDAPRRRRMLDGLAAAGATHLLTEGPAVPAWLAREVDRAGLALGGGLACFSDHSASIGRVPARLRPVTASGERRPRMEWYTGIIPTDRGYEARLVAAATRLAARAPIALLALDFIRWPLHWELELRPGRRVIDSSFDRLTLERFRSEANVDIDVGDPTAAAGQIHAGLLGAWTDFKCRVISGTVANIAAGVRTVRPDLAMAAFIVPGSDEQRRRHAGQDVAALGGLVDVLLPMTYHAIVQRSPLWVGQVVTDIRARSGAPVVPVVQLTAERRFAGEWDWGEPFGPGELRQAIQSGIDAGAAGLLTFPAHALDGQRLAAIGDAARALGSTS